MGTTTRTEIENRLQIDSPLRDDCTRQAYRLLPTLQAPAILDVGCGRGGPALVLARQSGGCVTGIDVDRRALAAFRQRVKAAGLQRRVFAVLGSMAQPSFSRRSFDLLWAEGSLWALGFERALRQLRPLLKPGGFLVAHEMIWLRPDPPPEVRSHVQTAFPHVRTVGDYLSAIADCGYDVLDYFSLPDDAWWQMFFAPLQARIQALRPQYVGNAAAKALLDQQQRQVDDYVKYRAWYGSAFFAMQS